MALTRRLASILSSRKPARAAAQDPVSEVGGVRAESGVRVFALVWVGQLVSLTGSGLTGFTLGVWTYQRTGSSTRYALIFAFTTLPAVLLSPLAGAFVDRFDRRRVMIFGNLGAGACVMALALLLFTQRLEVWHIYLAVAAQASFSTFQWLAFSASVTLLVPQRHLGRASGMTQLGEAVARIASPALASFLLFKLPLWGILLIDYLSFMFAVVTLLPARIPRPVAPAREAGRGGSLFREAAYGWTYIAARPGLLWLLAFFAVTNFLSGMVIVLGTPLILSFASAAALGTVLSAAGCGMLLGSLTMSLWGGPQNRVYGVLGCEVLAGVCMIVAGMRASVGLIAAATLCFFFCVPVILASSQALWQSKVAPGEQGRVFAVRRMIAWSSFPLAYLLAGPLADRIFTPLLVAGGPLAGTVGRVLGVGPQRGIGLLFVLLGALVILISVAGFLSPRLRLIERDLPDMPPHPCPAAYGS